MGYLKYAINGIKPKNFYYLSLHTFKDFLNKHYPVNANEMHITAAIKWLSLARKQNNDKGVSALYSPLSR